MECKHKDTISEIISVKPPKFDYPIYMHRVRCIDCGFITATENQRSFNYESVKRYHRAESKSHG